MYQGEMYFVKKEPTPDQVIRPQPINNDIIDIVFLPLGGL